MKDYENVLQNLESFVGIQNSPFDGISSFVNKKNLKSKNVLIFIVSISLLLIVLIVIGRKT